MDTWYIIVWHSSYSHIILCLSLKSSRCMVHDCSPWLATQMTHYMVNCLALFYLLKNLNILQKALSDFRFLFCVGRRWCLLNGMSMESPWQIVSLQMVLFLSIFPLPSPFILSISHLKFLFFFKCVGNREIKTSTEMGWAPLGDGKNCKSSLLILFIHLICWCFPFVI